MVRPKDHWPYPDAIATEADWIATVERIRAGISELRRLAADPHIDLTAGPHHWHGDETHILHHKIVDIAVHNAYHISEIVILSQAMALWSPDRARPRHASDHHSAHAGGCVCQPA